MRKIPTKDSWIRPLKEAAKPILLEKSPFEIDEGELIGRDPRKITRREFDVAGIPGDVTLLEVIRAKCLDCCVEQTEEVRKCVMFSCPNWPYRMGVNPFRSVNLTEQEKERRRAGIEALNRARKIKRRQIHVTDS